VSRLKQDFLVGSLFFLGIILVGIFTIVVKDISLIKGYQGRIFVVFKRVAGLEKGHKVLASGMEVGQVYDMALNEDGTVKVELSLTKKIKLYKDYKISVKDTSALGGKYVDVEVGSQEEGLHPISYVTGQEKKLQPLDGSAQHSLLNDPNLQEIFASVKKIVKDIEQGKGTLGLLLKEREIYDNIRATSVNIKEITTQMRSEEGTIGKLLYNKELYDKITQIASNIETITSKISQGKGTLGKLVADEKVYWNLRKTLENANKVTENLSEITDKVKRGEGTIGKLFTDDKVYNNLDRALADARTMMQGINQVVQQINAGKGTLGKLLQDEGMAENLKSTLSDIKVVAERLKKGEGTVGKLLADDTLYKEIRRVLKTLSDSIEDTREQVPISTFTSILFKAF
jgi:phospholipid/cholesterol/gamma-HCH transport system substrate-binding protein